MHHNAPLLREYIECTRKRHQQNSNMLTFPRSQICSRAPGNLRLSKHLKHTSTTTSTSIPRWHSISSLQRATPIAHFKLGNNRVTGRVVRFTLDAGPQHNNNARNAHCLPNCCVNRMRPWPPLVLGPFNADTLMLPKSHSRSLTLFSITAGKVRAKRGRLQRSRRS